MWDKEYASMRNYIMRKKSAKKEMKACEEIGAIPIELRKFILRRYLNACKQRHALAFF
jgi:hypothetical protein